MTVSQISFQGDNIGIFYVSRNEERRGIACIKECVDAKMQGLEKYAKINKERLFTTASNSNLNRINLRTNGKTAKKKEKINIEKNN